MKSKINPFRSPGISGAAISAAAIIFACFALLSSSAQATDALFVGSAGDHNLTTGSNWVGGSPAGDWDRMIFDGAVMDGLLDLNNFNGRSGITLTSDVTQDITILNDQPLIMGAVTSDGGIDMSSAAHDLTINTPYWIWGDAYWNVGAGRTLTINSGPSHDGSPTNPAPNSVTKNGVGSALLTSAAYYTGGTTINSGTFHASHALAVGSGGVTVNGGATLAVNAISANTGLTLLEAYAAAGFDDKAWQTMVLPALVPGCLPASYYWFRRVVELPSGLAGQDVTFDLGRIDDCDEFYVNGQKIGDTGVMPKNQPQGNCVSAWNQNRSYTVPAKFLKPGKNLLAICMYNHDGPGGFMPPEATKRETVGPFDSGAISGTAGGYTVGGTGWYRKGFKISADDAGKHVEILFGGIYRYLSDAW